MGIFPVVRKYSLWLMLSLFTSKNVWVGQFKKHTWDFQSPQLLEVLNLAATRYMCFSVTEIKREMCRCPRLLVKSVFFFWGLLECNVVQSLPKQVSFTLRQTYKQQCVCHNFVWIIGSQTRENLKAETWIYLIPVVKVSTASIVECFCMGPDKNTFTWFLTRCWPCRNKYANSKYESLPNLCFCSFKN